jgi:hypothetical protein
VCCEEIISGAGAGGYTTGTVLVHPVLETPDVVIVCSNKIAPLFFQITPFFKIPVCSMYVEAVVRTREKRKREKKRVG